MRFPGRWGLAANKDFGVILPQPPEAQTKAAQQEGEKASRKTTTLYGGR